MSVIEYILNDINQKYQHGSEMVPKHMFIPPVFWNLLKGALKN